MSPPRKRHQASPTAGLGLSNGGPAGGGGGGGARMADGSTAGLVSAEALARDHARLREEGERRR
jgi:hypothetical protein